MSHIQALPAGTELVDDFMIERVLGAGGFGITYLAREIALDRKVTIKEYFPADFAARVRDVSAEPRSDACAADYKWGLDRFIEEAQTLAKFDHPNIVRVYRYFRGNNTGYMVLHFEEGHSLKSWLQSLGRAPRQAELDLILAPLLDALAVVHASEFLHRDIAPDNIIIRNDGSPVLIDFGAARGDIAQHSRTVSALVKPGYSPYEQYGEIGRSQGPWTDIYALAATLYHAITGKRPPDAPSRVVNDALRPARDAALSAYRPSFLRAIDQGLTIDIEKRPQSVAEWRGALLAPDDSAEQRGWFGQKRVDKTVVADELGDVEHQGGRSATRALGGATRTVYARAPGHGAVPPPPDVPFQANAPGRRGRIVDFLEGGRRSPRDPTVALGLDGPSPPIGQAGLLTCEQSGGGQSGGGQAGGPLGARAGHVVDAGGLDGNGPPSAAAGRGGFWLWPRKRETREADGQHGHDAAMAAGGAALVVDIAGAANVRAAPQVYEKAKAVEAVRAMRKPPRPRPVRRASRWRLLPVAAKLAVGVVLATFFVQLQQRLPQIEFSSRGTVASGSGPPPQTVTGSLPKASESVSQAAVPGAAKLPPPPERSVQVASASAGAFKPLVKRAPVTLLLRTFEAHAGSTSAVQFADNGRLLVTVGADATLKVWDTKSYALLRTLEIEHGPAISLAIAGARALTGHEDGRIAFWDLTLGMQLKSFKRNDAPVSSLVFAGAEKFIAGADDWSVALWEISTPSLPLHVFEGHERNVLAVAYEPGQGLIASASADRTVKLWDSKSLSLIRTYSGARDFVTSVAFAPDGGSLLIGTLKGSVSLYSTTSRSRKRRYRGHGGRITSLKFIEGGREFVSASGDGTVRL